MKLLKQAMALLGSVVVIAVLVALVTPKTAHALVATLVQVVNTPSQPVPTWRTDNDGRSVVRLSYGEFMPAGTVISEGKPLLDTVSGLAYTVPAGERLVIDNVSLLADPPTGQKVEANFSEGPQVTNVPLIFEGTFGTNDSFDNAIPLRDYVEPGQQYKVTMIRSSGTDTMFWDAQAVGHLVDCTNGGGC